MTISKRFLHGIALFFFMLSPAVLHAEAPLFGFKIRLGGRYDNVRMCVATPAGVKGGMAADISLFADFPIENGTSVHVDLPVMRPILFGLAFKMLQFEPTVALRFSDQSDGRVGWIAGPALGVSLHYGPDYRSESSEDDRTADFFAIGPIIGAYAGLDFRRPGEKFNFQLGVSPYVTPLFGLRDPDNHKGIVIGGLVDASFRYGKAKR
ncbi:MAG: hypothetical protein JW915_07490 [Chitinispirillaceae bacterium]|nr:hypothetical protein [Chitinispirillaceae bacterium]